MPYHAIAYQHSIALQYITHFSTLQYITLHPCITTLHCYITTLRYISIPYRSTVLHYSNTALHYSNIPLHLHCIYCTCSFTLYCIDSSVLFKMKKKNVRAESWSGIQIERSQKPRLPCCARSAPTNSLCVHKELCIKKVIQNRFMTFCQPLGFSSYTLTWSKRETSKPCIKTVFWEPWTKDTFSIRRTKEAHSSFLLRFQYHFPPWLCLPLQLSISSLSRALEISLADVKSGSIEPAKARMYSTCDSTSFDKQWSYLEVPSQLPKFYKCGLVVGRLR